MNIPRPSVIDTMPAPSRRLGARRRADALRAALAPHHDRGRARQQQRERAEQREQLTPDPELPSLVQRDPDVGRLRHYAEPAEAQDGGRAYR